MLAAVLDHLWQSTLVALAAGILAAAAFRQASAGVRHGLWFAASLKFLVPFAALAALGRLLAPAGLFPARAAPEAALIVQTAQPLSRFPFAHAPALQAPLSTLGIPQPRPLPPIHVTLLDPSQALLALWALGCAAILLAWAIRWARVARIVRSANPIAWPAPMPVLASPSLMEPGLVGLFRPVLVLPETLPERLSRSEIDAILAHEISHLRRRDNLTAAIHMLVEALFWFHPMVWWIGARMIAEREQACDEAVVRAGHDRAAYARSLLESCRLYLRSPLNCVAGASGADLKTRVETIMTAPPSSPLSPLRKALLLAAGGCAFATPVAAGLLTSTGSQEPAAGLGQAASIASAVPAAQPTQAAPDDAAGRPIRLARNERVLGAALTVARFDAAPALLSTDIAAPRVATPPPAAATPPVQLATTAPPAPASAAAAPQPADPAQLKRQAAAFVQSYGEFTRTHTTARWDGELCLRVVGLLPEQEAAVKKRVEDVARAVGVTVPAGCKYNNVQIGFTTDPQGMLDWVVKGRSANLGDSTSDTRTVKTVTLPIQAWYVTNGWSHAANDRRDPTFGELKVPVVYQGFTAPEIPAPSNSPGPMPPYPLGPGAGDAAGGSRLPTRQFLTIFVIVDLRRTEGKSLGLISDYAAMLTLSQPRDLDQCNALPSVTDLFLSCGRPAPDGLTPADAAYLTALYQRGPHGDEPARDSVIAQRMGEILAGGKVASR